MPGYASDCDEEVALIATEARRPACGGPMSLPRMGARLKKGAAHLLDILGGGAHACNDARYPLEGIRLGVELGLLGHRLDHLLEAKAHRDPSWDNMPVTIPR